MDGEQSWCGLARHRARDRRAPVAALRDVARVAQALHQLGPGARDAIRVPASDGWLSGEAVARQGWNDDVESILGAAAMRGRVSERSDNLKLLNDGSGPAVRDDHWHGVRMSRADVDEVNIHTIDRRHELGQGIELGFALLPVVIGAPIAHELL